MVFFHSPRVKKFVTSITLFAFIFSSVYFTIPPKKSEALWPTADWLNTVIHSLNLGGTGVNATNSTFANFKEYILKPLAFALAKNMLQSITAQTVNWINSGFNGNPAYVTNPDQFFLNIGDKTVGNLLSKNGSLGSKICSPFQPQVRLALVQQYLQDDLNNLQQCSLTQVVKNYEGFINNFENGGWNAWFSVTQNQENNPYGAYIAANTELNLSLRNQTQKYEKQLQQGQGFLSYEKCIAKSAVETKTVAGNDELDNETGETYAGAATTVTSGGDCLRTETVTPGSVINDALRKSLGSGIDKLNFATDINQIVGALLNQAFKGVVGGVTKGLRGLSQGGSSSSSSNDRSVVYQLLDDSRSSKTASTTLGDITRGLPDTLSGTLGEGTDTLNPEFDEAALKAQIQATASQAAAQAAAFAAANVSPNDDPTRSGSGANTGTPQSICGNNICEENLGESSQTCSIDCVTN